MCLIDPRPVFQRRYFGTAQIRIGSPLCCLAAPASFVPSGENANAGYSAGRLRPAFFANSRTLATSTSCALASNRPMPPE
jgi:hypothetical protein